MKNLSIIALIVSILALGVGIWALVGDLSQAGTLTNQQDQKDPFRY